MRSAIAASGALFVASLLALAVPVPGPAAAQAAAMEVRVPGAGAVGGALFVFADGVLCGRFEVNEGAPPSVLVGTSDQPEACRRAGATLLFVDATGLLLVESATFESGASLEITNLAPPPPGTTYPSFVCDALEDEGVVRTACQMVAPAATVRWQFANRLPFADERAELAFALLIDDEAVDAAWPDDDLALSYADDSLIPQLESLPQSQAELLLAAAGIAPPGEPAALRESRRCLAWIPSGATNEPMLQAVASGLSAELMRVLGTLAVAVQPCAFTADAASADLLVWEAGQAPPDSVIDSPAPVGDGFLDYVALPPPGEADDAPGADGTSPTPSSTGNAGLSGAAGGAGRASAVLAAACVMVVLGARRMTRDGHRRA